MIRQQEKTSSGHNTILAKTIFAIFALLAITCFRATAAPEIRAVDDADITYWSMASNWDSLPASGPLSMADSVTRNQLSLMQYYRTLGYTHMYYNWRSGGDPRFDSATGVWDIDRGNYDSGPCARSFRSMKAALEAHGLIMIPITECLSHMDGPIRTDPSLSEFYDSTTKRSAFAAYCAEGLHHGQRVPDRPDCDHVAFVGNYPAIRNPSADRLFLLALHIINANWTYTKLGGPYPRLIHIGHDENGYGTDCLVAEGRAKRLLGPLTPADLVAREIAFRYQQVQDVVTIRGNRHITVMFWGDSYEPADNGQFYNLCGDIRTGEGGVLYKLVHDPYIKSIVKAVDYPIAPRLIVQPWMYSDVDGRFKAGGPAGPAGSFDFMIDKSSIVRYLSNLGLRYLPVAGEDGNNSVNFLRDAAWVGRVEQTVYEWVSASYIYPKTLAGFSMATWICRYLPGNPVTSNPVYFADRSDPNTLQSGFSAALLAYAAWTFPAAKRIAAGSAYPPDFFKGCDFRRSRSSLSWKAPK